MLTGKGKYRDDCQIPNASCRIDISHAEDFDETHKGAQKLWSARAEAITRFYGLAM